MMAIWSSMGVDATELAQRLWRACWQGSAGVLLVWLLCAVFPGIPARARCWLWRLAYLKFFAVLFFTTAIELPILSPISQAGHSASMAPTAASEFPSYPAVSIDLSGDLAESTSNWETWALGLWALGVVFFSVRLARNIRTGLRLTGNGRPFGARAQAEKALAQAQAAQSAAIQQHLAVQAAKRTQRLNVYSAKAGIIMAIHVKEGQVVEKGSPLLQLDNRVAKVMVEAALSRLDVARADMEITELEGSKALKDWERLQELVDKGFASADKSAVDPEIIQARIRKARAEVGVA